MRGDVENDFGAWSELSAALRGRAEGERGAILRHLGLMDRWDAIDARWARALLDDVAEGDLERVMRYGDACTSARTRRARGDDPFAQVAQQPAPAPPPPAPEPASAPTSASPPPAPPPSTAAPSSRPAAAPSGSFRDQLHRPIATDNAPRGPVLPDGVSFVSHMSGSAEAGLGPKQPAQGQAQTAGIDSHEEFKAMRTALAWTVDRYAAFCAALHHRAPEEVARDFSVVTTAFAGIHKAWRKRLEGDPQLNAAYHTHWAQLAPRG